MIRMDQQVALWNRQTLKKKVVGDIIHAGMSYLKHLRLQGIIRATTQPAPHHIIISLPLLTHLQKKTKENQFNLLMQCHTHTLICLLT